MGVIAIAKVVTSIEKACIDAIQPGNREQVTVIESINSTRWILPPLIIFKGKLHQLSWYESIPPDWMIGVSENGWTTDKIGLTWLKKIFGLFTENRITGKYRLLILDGHGSHVTAEFDRYYTEHFIIILYMPLYLSYLFQPLDIVYFIVLKQLYRLGIQA